MASSDAENSTFICDHSATELGDAELVVQGYFVRDILFDVEEVDGFAAPLKVVDKLVRWVALLENKCIVEQLTKFVDHIHVLVVRNATWKLTQFPHFKDQVLLDLVQLSSDELESVEVPLLTIRLQIDNLFLKLF